MKQGPHITVAPNGARLQKADHSAVPLSAKELAATARACFVAGAATIHLHVREVDGTHSLDIDLYQTAIAAVKRAAPAMNIQITTESAGRYDVPEQLHLLDELRPMAASVSVREIARSPDHASLVYATAQRHGTQVQHILYGASCLDQLERWRACGTVPEIMRDAILVLGQYAPPRAGHPNELAPLMTKTRSAGLRMSVCAFGEDEQACLGEAYRLGCDLRVGFENNLRAPNGTLWKDNAQAVLSLRTLLDTQKDTTQNELRKLTALT